MTAPREIIQLVERFTRHRDAYHAPAYNEAQVRKEFIDPLFEALGWDMANRQGKAEAYKEVIHEASLKISGATKAPDYAFRIGETRKFFLEAKKPAVDIKAGIDPAYQLRRYAWSAKLPLSILTDFEEFAVYQCNIRPRPTDKAATARVRLWSYLDYVEKWDEIAGIFSKTAIEQGSFDKFVGSEIGKRGTSEVDAEFLTDIEDWRDMLAHNIASRNRRLSVDDLNNAVQRTIDRIIFLRMCEDRGIEPYGQLQRLVDNGYIYSDLLKLYERADKRYNSGLFHFEHEKGRGEPDTLTPSLKIENDILKKIIGSLYYPDCPYEFSVLPAEILGNVYEQFLGKVIRLTASHQARVEEKPEVKKAGGVYYTPKYIVDYIVKNTVGKLCEGKTPKQIEKLRILDPACGSGSFLLGAYTCLLDYHRDWYARRWPKQFKKEMYRDKLGQLHLATAEKKRILLNNIYGVDIDPQAVEVTKLSLLLKILEGENAATLEQQRLPLDERALPDLDNNIKCGNSLIGPDYFSDMLIPDREEMKRINPFDWKHEFPEIFLNTKNTKNKGGFDCVIGNPPYIFGEWLKPEEKRYFERTYATATGQYDYYHLFVEMAGRVLQVKGLHSLIIPDAVLAREETSRIRKIWSSTSPLLRVAHVGSVFKGVGVSSIVFVSQRGGMHPSSIAVDEVTPEATIHKTDISSKRLRETPHHRLLINVSDANYVILKKLRAFPPMSNRIDVSRGEEIGKKDAERGRGTIPIIVGEDIERYSLRAGKRRISAIMIEKGIDFYRGPKLLMPKTGKHPMVALDHSDAVCMQSVYMIRTLQEAINIKVLLAILNSKLAFWFFHSTVTSYKKLFPQLNQSDVYDFPVPETIPQQDRFLKLVERMLALHKQFAKAKGEQERKVIQRQIDSTDRDIDALVYELYGLTDKEIAIVEAK